MTRTYPPEYQGNNPRNTQPLLQWHAQALPEPVLEPDLPCLDSHHHLYGTEADARHYRMQDLMADLGSGHRMIGTVYVEGYHSGWRTSGPEALRPVGEVEMVMGHAGAPQALPSGPCQVAAGIVSYADLLLGSEVAAVLEAQQQAAQGRLRGVRFSTARDPGRIGTFLVHLPPEGQMTDPAFLRGVGQLQQAGLSFDTWVYHHQLPELTRLVDAFPSLPFVLNHAGGLLGVAEYAQGRASIFGQWMADMRELARRPNVAVKIGGLGMPVMGFGFEHEARPATSMEACKAWQPRIDACVEFFGPARCLLETNFPPDKQSLGYLQMWNAYKLATRHLSPDERRDLFYRTACRVYRLPGLLQAGDATG